jgi:hypothetical protein
MITNAKVVSGVGHLLVDMLRFWHSTVDCASFGLIPKVSLLVSMLAPSGCCRGNMRVVVVGGVGAVAKMPVVG